MRIVDLAWQNDPRLRWVSLKAPPEAEVTATDPAVVAQAPAPKGQSVVELAKQLTEEEKRKQAFEDIFGYSDWCV